MRSDQAYSLAAEAKRGRLSIPDALQQFAVRVERRYGPRPLWIATDHIVVAGPDTVRRRVDLVFERTADHQEFLTDGLSFSTVRQDELARDFAETVGPAARDRLFGAPGGNRVSADLFVCFSDFEPAAREAAHTSVPLAAIDDLARRLGLGDSYWQSSRLWGAPTVFVQTDEQARRLSSSADFRARLDDAYFELVDAYDEFGVVERRLTSVAIDSKENFDSTYEGSWFYYWK